MTAAHVDPARVGEVVERIIEAHGGLPRWRQVATVELHLSSGGLAFGAKGQPRALHGVTATIGTTGQRGELKGSLSHPWHARFDGVRRGGAAPLGEQLAALRRGRRRLFWSVADVGAFAAAALWTYVHVPFVLADPDVEVETLGPWTEKNEAWLRLGVTFPERVATHSRRQILYVDGDYRIRRHDYTALAFGWWARAAQYLSHYREVDGLSLSTRREVYPRLPGGRRAGWPLLVWIDIERVTLR